MHSFRAFYSVIRLGGEAKWANVRSQQLYPKFIWFSVSPTHYIICSATLVLWSTDTFFLLSPSVFCLSLSCFSLSFALKLDEAEMRSQQAVLARKSSKLCRKSPFRPVRSECPEAVWDPITSFFRWVECFSFFGRCNSHLLPELRTQLSSIISVLWISWLCHVYPLLCKTSLSMSALSTLAFLLLYAVYSLHDTEEKHSR